MLIALSSRRSNPVLRRSGCPSSSPGHPPSRCHAPLPTNSSYVNASTEGHARVIDTILLSSCDQLQRSGMMSASVDPTPTSVVVLFTGLAGSVLETRLRNASSEYAWCPQNQDWTVTWVTVAAAVRPDCLLSNLAVYYDEATDTCEALVSSPSIASCACPRAQQRGSYARLPTVRSW